MRTVQLYGTRERYGTWRNLLVVEQLIVDVHESVKIPDFWEWDVGRGGHFLFFFWCVLGSGELCLEWNGMLGLGNVIVGVSVVGLGAKNIFISSAAKMLR